MNDKLRSLMRRVALGLPLAVPILASPFTMGFGCYPLGYECPTEMRQVVVQHANDGDMSEIECREACGSHTSCASLDAERVQCVQMQRVCPPAGRPPRGELATLATPIGEDPALAWLRDAALMEAASVGAFEELAWRLGAFDAPAGLVERAHVAAADELRHAHAMTALLAARTEEPVAIRVSHRRGALGTVPELAADNVVDGCLGEAWGALEAAVQAERAEDADVREAMAIIAREEAEHALLSADIHRWARSRMSAPELAGLDLLAKRERSTRRAALADRTVPAGLGLLAASEAVALFDATA